MFTKVSGWVDLIALEENILKFWQEQDCFNKLREKNRGKKTWSFLDGPMTANNPMGVHHAMCRTYKDSFQRYFAMNGHDLRYQNGYDCQGLWVEVEVEKELGFKNKRDIENYGIEKFINACKERVRKYGDLITKESVRLGYWMDWDNSYWTMSEENNYTIWSFLKKCHDRKLVYSGNDVVPWCSRCGTAISQHEMHGTYKAATHDTIVARFPLKDRSNEYLLVWTTTPWTLTSNVAAAVNPNLTYAKVEQDGAFYYLAKKCVASVFKGSYTIVEEFPGKKLDGWQYHGPFDELPAQAKAREQHRVILWDIVAEDEGSGIVHIAPGCGKEDHDLGKLHQLENICPIDESGLFLSGFDWLTGQNAQNVAKGIIENLKTKNILFRSDKYEHNYPHCWRCKQQLLFRLVDEWYIAVDPWRQEIIEIAGNAKWIPAFGREMEQDWLRNMHDWMISKKRYWGLALPIWHCEDCHTFDVIGGRDELKARAVEGWAEFEGHTPHRPWIDQVKIACPKCGKAISRIKDVGNPWLDAGIVPYSTMNYNLDREYWEKWFPPDLIFECLPDQFRNWFYAVLAMSTIMEKKLPFRCVAGCEYVKDEKGEEMHKSKGNAIWYHEAVAKIGSEVMRWMFLNQDYNVPLRFGYTPAKEVRGKFFNTFINSFSFFINYAAITEFVPSANPTPYEDRPDLDRWILGHLQKLVKIAHKGYSEYTPQTVIRNAELFIDNLSNWYIKLSRRRFWKGQDSFESKTAYETLYECLWTFIQVVAPALPMLTEYMYQNLIRSWDEKAPISIHLTDFPKVKEDEIDEDLLEEMDIASTAVAAGLAAREAGHLKIRQPLSECLIIPRSATDERAIARFQEIFLEYLNVKKVTVLPIKATFTDADLAVFEAKEIKVAMRTTLDEELIKEGIMRDLVRNLQELRKKSGLEIEDRIRLTYYTDSELVQKTLVTWLDFIKSELLCEAATVAGEKGADFKEVAIRKEKFFVKLEKC
jgi:isoleucyl-tRNA synthetase